MLMFIFSFASSLVMAQEPDPFCGFKNETCVIQNLTQSFVFQNVTIDTGGFDLKIINSTLLMDEAKDMESSIFIYAISSDP